MPTRHFEPLRPVISIDRQPEVNAHALTLTRSVGGERPDTLKFEIERTGQRDMRLIKTELRKQFADTRVDLKLDGQLMFVGRLLSTEFSIGKDGERITYEARLDDHLFGRPVDRRYVAGRSVNVSSSAPVRNRSVSFDRREMVFNPTDEDQPLPNRCSTVLAPAFGVDRVRSTVFIDPHSVLQEKLYDYITAAEGNDDPAPDATGLSYWTLPDIVHYLCWSLNPDEEYVGNPSLADLNDVLGRNQQIIRNRRINYGDYLPKALDGILTPYGYAWCMSFDDNVPRIRVFNRAESINPIWIPLDAVGGRGIDPAAKMSDLTMDFSSKAANSVRVVGAPLLLESTFELRPGWKKKYDNLPTVIGSKAFSPGWTDLGGVVVAAGKVAWDADPEFRRAWRDWVLNEGADYDRAEPWDNDLARHLPFTNVILSKRRKLKPCVTINPDGSAVGDVNGIVVEYWDPNLATWKNVRGDGGHDDMQNVQILQKECGIRFASPNGAPSRLMAIATQYGMANCRIRVTASIELDEFIVQDAVAGQSLLATDKKHVVHLPGKYQWKEVGGLSRHLNGVRSGTYRSTSVSDVSAAFDLASEILANWNKGNLNGEIQLHGVRWKINVGTSVAGLKPRDVDFRTAPGNGKTYPIVTGIRWDFQSQTQTLSLDTYYPSRQV